MMLKMCDLKTPAQEWLNAGAYVLTAQSKDAPEGIQLDVKGVKLCLKLAEPFSDNDQIEQTALPKNGLLAKLRNFFRTNK